jgi:ABC-type nitrate/sulfonate/bicarbonate transport system substrate-binding protein
MLNVLTRRRLLRGVGSGLLCGTAFPLLTACDDRKSERGPAAATKPLSLQSAWVNDAEFMGYFIAIEKGFYEAEGVSFKYLPGGPDKVADEVLVAKACDVALTTPDGTVSAIVKQNAPLKIIGTQYQKSPLGIVTLVANKIMKPQDLVGRTLAVPAANRLTTEAFLQLAGVNPRDVRFVNYQYDPTLLVEGIVDATVDFVTNVPYSIRLRNKEPYSFLFWDYGFRLFNDTVAVSEDTLKSKRKELVGFLRASRKGWEENFKDINKYPPLFEKTWFKGTGRTIDNEKYFNEQQKPLIETAHGIYSMSEEAIEDNIKSLNSIGIKATRSMFVTDLLAEL